MSDESVKVPEWIAQSIAEVQRPTEAIPTRYPYTYAYDFVRGHAETFGLYGLPSRAEVARWLRLRLGVDDDSPLLDAVVRRLADAYLAEHNEVLPDSPRRTDR